MLIESNEVVPVEHFFAPSNEGALDHLFGQRDAVKARIERIANLMDPDARLALQFCLDAERQRSPTRTSIEPDSLLHVGRAVAALDAAMWDRAMKLTDVRECMPQARRDDWHKQISEHQTPEFTPDNVLPTFEMLLTSRTRFLAERVDGVFQALSRKHVTNQPEGFGKRMILQYVLSEFGLGCDYRRAGLIHDLRCVIARFMGRDDPQHSDSSYVIEEAARRAGEWISIDGGALRLRVYTGVRTGHLEVHPDMAWRLNSVLASLHPAAIPSQFREPPKRRVKAFDLMLQPLPFAVLELLRGLSGKGMHRSPSYTITTDKAKRRRLDEVVSLIGGVADDDGWNFDYDPADAISEILCSGCIPDAVSHQYYPTPEYIARAAVDAAQIGPDDECLEPSAGTGGLADLMPRDRTQCVEVNALHCAVLRSKLHEVAEADFLSWRPAGVEFDRVVMNPPYSEGRWQAHVEHAAGLVAKGGRLVAILPESARNKRSLPGFDTSWGEVYKFPGTSISVSILTAVRP